MDRKKTFKSIREREQKVLGIYSFSDPIVHGPDEAGRQTNRRNQVFRAQKKHRARTQEYMAALESEIERLRAEAADLLQTSSNWRRSTLALIGPPKDANITDHWTSLMGPGVFLWAVTGVPSRDAGILLRQFAWLQAFPDYVMNYSYTTILPAIELCDATTRLLLFNFCAHIAPTLDVTEAATHGYIRHVVPLALENDMVRDALLAASASQMQSKQIQMGVLSLRFRTAAIIKLQNASMQSGADRNSALLALATILGLLIDDMIKGNKDFSMLMKLADTWGVLHPPDNNSLSYKELRKFLLDQIQMLKTLVHPLYMFSQSYNPAKKTFASIKSPDSSYSYPKIYDIFTNIQRAVAQACTLYKVRPTQSSLGVTSSASSDETHMLLDNLQSIVGNIPSFTPGENTLVWVYSIAASRSTTPNHCAFFTSRLAELLDRIGHPDIPNYLSTLSIC